MSVCVGGWRTQRHPQHQTLRDQDSPLADCCFHSVAFTILSSGRFITLITRRSCIHCCSRLSIIPSGAPLTHCLPAIDSHLATHTHSHPNKQTTETNDWTPYQTSLSSGSYAALLPAGTFPPFPRPFPLSLCLFAPAGKTTAGGKEFHQTSSP